MSRSHVKGHRRGGVCVLRMLLVIIIFFFNLLNMYIIVIIAENAVLRVPILYGDIEKLDESAVTVLFPKVQDTSKDCVMSDYERRYPTHCRDVAKVLYQMAEEKVKASFFPQN